MISINQPLNTNITSCTLAVLNAGGAGNPPNAGGAGNPPNAGGGWNPPNAGGGGNPPNATVMIQLMSTSGLTKCK